MRRISHRTFSWLWRVVAAAVVTLASPSHAAEDWPSVELPPHVDRFDVGRHMMVNGSPARIEGFLSDAPVNELVDWFRRSLGEPLVESRLRDKRILGRAEGDYYITIQLERVDARGAPGTRGLVSITRMRASDRVPGGTSTHPWLARLPAGSRVDSNVTSYDGPKASSHLMFSNNHGVALNVERVVDLMREDGYALEREATPPASPELGARRPVEGRSLYFKAPDREAQAVVVRLNDGRTSVVVNTVVMQERAR
jgi:hypothetical protein